MQKATAATGFFLNWSNPIGKGDADIFLLIVMINIDDSNYELVESDEVFTFKNENTTLGFVRFNDKGEVEYIFVNPIFRKQKPDVL